MNFSSQYVRLFFVYLFIYLFEQVIMKKYFLCFVWAGLA